MQNINDLIWKDQSTMERICKIIEAIWQGIITFDNEGEGDIVCHIGEYWFYFFDTSYFDNKIYADEITPANIHEYSIFTIAQMILDAIIDLDDAEYTYYCDTLQF